MMAARWQRWWQRGNGGQHNGGIGSALAAVAAPQQSVGNSVAAAVAVLSNVVQNGLTDRHPEEKQANMEHRFVRVLRGPKQF
jgi:hypothetical protein